MLDAMPDFRRKPNRLPTSNYAGPRSYLVTLCLQGRRPLFTKPQLVHRLISLLGQTAQAHFFDVYAYCFMPDHCHLVLCGLRPTSQLSTFVRAFKGHATVALRSFGLHTVWQHRFHDHVIRNHDDLRASAQYVLDNPVRAGLVKDPRDYPFSGSLVFEWRLTADHL